MLTIHLGDGVCVCVGSGNVVPRSGLLAPSLGVLEVQYYLVSQNSGPRLWR